MISPANTTTILTVLTFILGIVTFVYFSPVVLMITMSVTLGLPYLIPQFNHMLPRHLL